MFRPRARLLLAPTLAFAAIGGALFSFGCQDTLTEPEFARVNSRYQLTIAGTGSATPGVITSDAGGLSCTVAANGRVSGRCSQKFRSGEIVTLFLAPSAGGELGTLKNCAPAGQNAHACDVVMTQDWGVTVNFTAQATMASLTISGGAAGSGQVTSAPAGISCTITDGAAGSTGCVAAYTLNASVTLTATAASGSHLKAWAGGGCDTKGTGAGQSVGTCTVSMSRARAVLVSFDKPANVALVGRWSNPFPWQVVGMHSSLLPNGKVISWGRTGRVPVVWDPVARTHQSTGRPVDYFCSGHALLPNGRLFVAGGHAGVDHRGIRSTVIYDPATNGWSTGPTMGNGRWYPTVTALPNGEMLIVSGGDTAKALNQIPEVYTTTGSIRALTGARASIPYYPMMFVAPSGKVFVAGPSRGTGYLTTDGIGSWTSGPASSFGFRGNGSGVMYSPGKILIVGGGGTPTNTAEVIDLNAGSSARWRSVAPMRVGRGHMTATLLADGTVLVTGGTNASGFNPRPTDNNVLAAERWNPATEQWTQLARKSHYRLYHSAALLLPDGRVLSLGSGEPAATGLSDDLTGEVFWPPYLYSPNGALAPRPSITSAPASVSYGESFSVGISTGTSVAKVTWIRLSNVTHATDMNQRINVLPFGVASASSLSVTAPLNPNLAPPGHYMLFVIDANGVPSVAKIVRISAGGVA